MDHTASNRNSPQEIASDDSLRSSFAKELIANASMESANHEGLVPRVIVQFWDNLSTVPRDVRECVESWTALETSGYEHHLFDDQLAAQFIVDQLGPRHLDAFRRCEHPAMRSDYFRLCYMQQMGGAYVDADDVYQGLDIEALFTGAALKLQPLCYDNATNSMIEPVAAARDVADDRIFYFNNNPLIAPSGHPIIERALERATKSLLTIQGECRDIQSLTGPGNLTASVVEHLAGQLSKRQNSDDVAVLADWESTALSKWPLDYRADDRNWRLWIRGGSPSS